MQQIIWQLNNLSKVKEQILSSIKSKIEKPIVEQGYQEIRNFIYSSLEKIKNQVDLKGENLPKKEFIKFALFEGMVDDLELRVKYKPLHLDPMDKYKLLEIIRHWKMFFHFLGGQA